MSCIVVSWSILNITAFCQTNNTACVKPGPVRCSCLWPSVTLLKYRRIMPKWCSPARLLRHLIRYHILTCYSNLSTMASEIPRSSGLQSFSVVIRNTSCWMASSLPRHLSHLAFLKTQSSVPCYFLFPSMMSRVEFVPHVWCLLMAVCCTMSSKPCMTSTHSSPTLTVSRNGIHCTLLIQPHYRVKQLLWKLQFFTSVSSVTIHLWDLSWSTHLLYGTTMSNATSKSNWFSRTLHVSPVVD